MAGGLKRPSRVLIAIGIVGAALCGIVMIAVHIQHKQILQKIFGGMSVKDNYDDDDDDDSVDQVEDDDDNAIPMKRK